MTAILKVDVATYEQHPMHADTQTWPQTNCALDLWIEVLHALGLDAQAAGACALAADMRGDQWLFLKLPIEDLQRLYGVTVDELTVWRPVLEHVLEHAADGRLLTVEVDSWFLPDTAGVSYGLDHVKSSIVPNVVDPAGRRMEYFHNSGYYELTGDDFDGVFRLGAAEAARPLDAVLAPYVEVVSLDAATGTRDLLAVATELARTHLARRRPGNPVARFAERIRADLPWLAAQDLATFHVYAFAMMRQCGASAQLAADFVRWLTAQGEPGLAAAAAAFDEVASAAKSLQFQMARVVRGRTVAVDPTLELMTDAWQRAIDDVLVWAG